MGNAALVQDGSAAKYKESKMALYKDVKTKLKEVQERVSAIRTGRLKSEGDKQTLCSHELLFSLYVP